MKKKCVFNEAKIRKYLQADPPITDQTEKYNLPFINEKLIPAAVLIPLVRYSDDDWHILYTRRTNLVAEHKGQVSFPGGRKNPDDAYPRQTALREAQEEIGLNSNDVRILGELESMPTVSKYRVVPVVGIIPWPYKFRLQPLEVERIFTLPLKWLAKRENYTVQIREINNSDHSPFKVEVIYYQPYDGEVLWGVSAEITLNLLERLRLVNRK